MKKILRRAWKILIITVVCLLLLVLLLFVALKLPVTQRYIADRAESFIEGKTNTQVNIGHLEINFPKAISIEDLFVEDRNRDTLLFAGRIGANIAVSDLMNKKITLSRVGLNDINARVIKENDTFNFNHFIEAFSDTTTAPADTASGEGGWEFAMDEIELNNIRGRYYDLDASDSIDARLGHFQTSFSTFQLDPQAFHLEETSLKNTNFRMVVNSTSSPPEQDTASTALPDFQFEKLSLENINAEYRDRSQNQFFATSLGQMLLIPDEINLEEQSISIDEFELKETMLTTEVFSPPDTSRAKSQKEESSSAQSFPLDIPWDFAMAEFDINKIDLNYHNLAVPDTTDGFDPNHLAISELDFAFNDLLLEDGDLQVELNRLSIATDDKFQIKKLQTALRFNDNEIQLDNFSFASSHSTINSDIILSYPSFQEFIEDLSSGDFNIAIDNSSVSVSDIRYFVPALPDTLFKSDNIIFQLALSASGNTDKTDLEFFRVAFGEKSNIELSGTFENLLNPDELAFESVVENYFTGNDIKNLLHKTLIPEGVYLPTFFTSTLDVDGSINDFYSEWDAESDVGDLFSQLQMQNLTNGEIPIYDISLKAEDLNLQKLTAADSSGPGLCSFDLQAQGSGFAPEEMDSEFDLALHHLHFNRYDYRKLELDGEIENGMLTSSGSIRDSNIIVTIDNQIDLSNIYNANVDLIVEAADLQELHFSSEDVRTKGHLKLKSKGNSLSDLNGNLEVRELLVILEGERYTLDSLLVSAQLEKESTDITVNSDFLNGWVKGNINPADFALAIKNQVNNYIHLFDVNPDSLADRPHFSFDFSVNQTDLISEVFLPDLKTFESVRIRGQFNEPENQQVNMILAVPRIEYANLVVDSLMFEMNGDSDSLKTKFGFDRLQYDTLTVNKTAIGADIGKGKVSSYFSLLDSDEEKKYSISALIEPEGDDFSVHLSEEVLLNYAEWSAPEDNSILIGDRTTFHNFSINRDNMKVALENVEDEEKGFKVIATEFSLASISNILGGDVVPLKGLVNGSFTSTESSPLAADIEISNIEVFEKPLGNLDIDVAAANANTYGIDILLSGNGNSIITKGSYAMQDSIANLDIETNIEKINLESFNPFVAGYLSDMNGNMTGKINIEGAASDPSIVGYLNFDKVWLKVDYLNAHFNLRNEKLELNQNGISFPGFTVRDSTGNKATVDGTVKTENYVDYNFDLDITTNDYKVLSTTKETEEFYYGTIILDSEIAVKGPMNELDVNADINLANGTVFNMRIPQSDAAAQERSGIVEFINPDASLEEDILTKQKSEASAKSEFTNLNFNSKITVDEETELNIIIDPVTGDKLSVKGGANLSLSINPGGNVNMVGNYTIKEGKYEMKAFGVMRREFAIEEGSSLEWSGDPLKAKMNITAIYSTRTSPYNLVAPYMASAGASNELQELKGQLPFRVHLMMKDELMQPSIAFDITLPESKRNAMGGRVYARLNQLRENESEMNKQVFALLILNSFIADNPAGGSNDGSNPASAAARKSVSRFLSDQLNRLSDKYIQGVNVEVDIESYEDRSQSGSTGQTDVNLNVSKSLMDDRLILKVGSSIAVEGDEARRQNASDLTGDLILEYKITEDGRYRFKAFRVNSYENLAVGQVTETGGGVIFTRDYDNVEELFRKPEETETKEQNEE